MIHTAIINISEAKNGLCKEDDLDVHCSFFSPAKRLGHVQDSDKDVQSVSHKILPHRKQYSKNDLWFLNTVFRAKMEAYMFRGSWTFGGVT